MAGDGVKVFIGSLANHLGLAASAAAERYGSVYFETTAVSEEFTDRGLQHVFRASTPGVQMGTTAIEFGKQYLEKTTESGSGNIKVAIVFEPNWQLIAEAARDKAKSYGWDVVVYTNYDSTSLDFSPLVAQLKEAKPDLVLAGGWLNDSVLLNRQSKQVGFWPRAWIGLSGGNAIDDYANNLGDLANGVFVVNASSVVADSALTVSGQELKERFLTRWDKVNPGQAPNGLVYEAFSNAWVLMHEALPKAKSLGNDDIRDALLAVDLENGSLPNGTGAKFTNNGVNTRTFYSVLQWQNKKLVTIWPDKLATSKIFALDTTK
jgi:branched-chain amino acid transport system substrate-binding protein